MAVIAAAVYAPGALAEPQQGWGPAGDPGTSKLTPEDEAHIKDDVPGPHGVGQSGWSSSDEYLDSDPGPDVDYDAGSSGSASDTNEDEPGGGVVSASRGDGEVSARVKATPVRAIVYLKGFAHVDGYNDYEFDTADADLKRGTGEDAQNGVVAAKEGMRRNYYLAEGMDGHWYVRGELAIPHGTLDISGDHHWELAAFVTAEMDIDGKAFDLEGVLQAVREDAAGPGGGDVEGALDTAWGMRKWMSFAQQAGATALTIGPQSALMAAIFVAVLTSDVYGGLGPPGDVHIDREIVTKEDEDRDITRHFYVANACGAGGRIKCKTSSRVAIGQAGMRSFGAARAVAVSAAMYSVVLESWSSTMQNPPPWEPATWNTLKNATASQATLTWENVILFYVSKNGFQGIIVPWQDFLDYVSQLLEHLIDPLPE